MIVHSGGVELYAEDHYPEEQGAYPEAQGTPVLLLHGWPDSSALWRHQVLFLTAHGFRVITPDLRGFGRSDRPEGVTAYSLQKAVSDVVGILDAFDIVSDAKLNATGRDFCQIWCD